VTLRVVQVNCVIDGERRGPEALLAAWPTLPAIARAAHDAGAEVIVLQASRFNAEHRRDGVTYRFVAEPRLGGGSGPGLLPSRLAAAAAREAPDVIHFNGLDFPFHARAMCRLGVPVLLQDHASRADARIGPLRRWGHERVAAAIFTAAAQAEPFLARRQLPADAAIFAVPESSSGFTPGDQAEARRATGLSGSPALLWVGHFDSNKDPLTILQAVRKALPALPDLKLWCAFAGTQLLPEVERMLGEDPALAAHVHLLGRVPHGRVEPLCRASDFFLLGSRREGSGYALIEALACGVTPIVSDIPAFRALTGGGAVGALARPGDADGFAAAILAQAARPAEAARRAVRDHFERHLSFEVVGARLVEAYAAVAGKRAA
jgi:glycosyltransferase involved in cell wall biosynthesis